MTTQTYKLENTDHEFTWLTRGRTQASVTATTSLLVVVNAKVLPASICVDSHCGGVQRK